MNNFEKKNIIIDNQLIEIKIFKIFEHEIIKCKISKYLYESLRLKKSIDEVFNLEQVLNASGIQEQNGKIVSTIGLGSEYVINLQDIFPLLTFISSIILKVIYGDENTSQKIYYRRMWMNKMYKDCSVKCHDHLGMSDGTAIFYYEVPVDGGELIILKNSIDEDISSEHDDIAHYMKVETGDLIIHRCDVPHAISKHMSNNPRISFIFDFEKTS